MKKIIMVMFAMALLLSAGCASMAPAREQDRIISQVYEVPGYSKEVLFEKTKMWIAQNFKSAKAVIEYENKTEGTIIGNGSTKYPCEGFACVAKHDWIVPFTMKVDMKDDKIRLTFNNLRVAWPASNSGNLYSAAGDHEMTQQGDYDAIRPILLGFGNDIKASLSKESSADKW